MSKHARYSHVIALLLLVNCSFLAVKATEVTADQLILSSRDEEEAQFRLDATLSKGDIDFSLNLLLELMKKNWWYVAGNLTEQYYNPNNKDIIPEIVTYRKKHLNHSSEAKFNEYLKSVPVVGNRRIQIVAPCFMWAQNKSHVFAKIKFAARIDMPSPSKIFNVTVLWRSNGVHVTAVSIESDVVIFWELIMKTYLNINVHLYNTWYFEEQNSIVMELTKSPAIFWKNFYLNELETLPNQYFWWDMHYRYQDELGDQIGYLIDKEHDLDKLEDNKEKLNARRGRDRKKMIKRLEKDKTRIATDVRQRMQCWDLVYNKKCKVMDPFDWNSWFF